jgi:hypothetical protein
MYVYDENLVAAQQLIKSRINTSEKRSDTYATKFYKSYQTKLTRLRGEKRTHYQTLFEKEKNFKKEYKTYIKAGDEYSLIRAGRMVNLAIKYAQEQNLEPVLIFLYKYQNLNKALIYDLNTSHDLSKLTNKKKDFLKTLETLLEDDSLEVIQQGVELVNQCYYYSSLTACKLDTVFFSGQRIVAANAIADWNERQGMSAELSKLTGESVIARLDSLNREGIYKWKDMILVIGTVKFSSKSEMVKRGEAIIDADKTILNYIRVNKVAKVKENKTQSGKTYMVPYITEKEKTYYMFDIQKKEWQYMICYKNVINPTITEKMSRFLPPLQFKEEIQE